MDNARQQIVDNLKSNSNILLTVSTDPSVDELSAALGLTIILNNMDKRATAIFSGGIPPAINFLEPTKTFESSADSLRDFIIALDKEKADHLRYKVDGDLVKIFITPYKTTLSEKDLEFSQGDYNVELVLALGVKDQDHLDKAIEAQGKILHDAVVVTVTAGAEGSSLGSLDWHDEKASSLCEMVAGLAEGLKTDQPVLDEQISTALLTGIVSATDRFSNDRTSSRTMTVAAQLMAAGANQQLIAAKLEEAHDIAPGSVAIANMSSSNESNVGEDSSELTIERPGRTSSAKSAPKDESADSPSSEQDANEQELENQLAGLKTPPAGTLADIEKELQEQANAPEQSEQSEEPAPTPESFTAVSDAMMPGFEAPQPTVSAPMPEPVAEPPLETSEEAPALPPMPFISDQPPAPDASLPVMEPATQALPDLAAPVVGGSPEEPASLTMPPDLTATSSPQIVNQHGTIVSQPESTPPINSIQNNPNEGEQATVDPFTMPALPPTPLQESMAATPPAVLEPLTAQTESNVNPGGTPEGAALLASDTSAEPAPQPEFMPPQPAPVVPELPPLPQLPMDATLPPLPPPPPPPPTFQPGGAMPAGAVSGDVFGDGGAAPASPESVAPPPPPEPGQFKIPGQ